MVTVITGATRGIGRAIAEQFAAIGSDLIITSRNSTDLLMMKKELEQRFNIQVVYRAANFTKKADVVLLAEFIKQHPDPVDVLVNNVGEYETGVLFEQPADRLDELFRLNFFSAHILTAGLVESMKERGRGHIFNICSVVSKYPRHEAAFYTLSKQTLYAWSKLLTESLRPFGVKATAILPGSVYTSSWGNDIQNSEAFIQPEEVARAVYDCYALPGASIVEDIVIRPSKAKFD